MICSTMHNLLITIYLVEVTLDSIKESLTIYQLCQSRLHCPENNYSIWFPINLSPLTCSIQACVHAVQLVALQLSFNNFLQTTHYQRLRLVQKSLSRELLQLTAHQAQQSWPLSSCQDSIWHMRAPLHMILANTLVNQPDLHLISQVHHSQPS